MNDSTQYYLKVEMLQQDNIQVIFKFTAMQSFHCRYININTNIGKLAFEISCGDVDSLVIFVII